MLDGTNGVYGEEIGSVAHVGGSTGWEEADRQLRRCARERARLDVDEAAWLIVAWRTRAHVHRGCATFNEYLERELGYTPRAADDRMRVAKALNAMPKLRAAMVDGRLPFTAVRELVRVIRKDTEGEWVEAAAGKTVREIETMVAGRKPGDRPTDRPDPKLVRHSVLTARTDVAGSPSAEAARHSCASTDGTTSHSESRCVAPTWPNPCAG
jgi:hypothetical protein